MTEKLMMLFTFLSSAEDGRERDAPSELGGVLTRRGARAEREGRQHMWGIIEPR